MENGNNNRRLINSAFFINTDDDIFSFDVDSDFDQSYEMETQRLWELPHGLSYSIQGFSSFDTSCLNEDEIPTRDAGLDLSFSNKTSRSFCFQDELDDDLTTYNDLDLDRNSRCPRSSSKKKRTKSKTQRRGLEASRNNNSLDSREKFDEHQQRSETTETKPEDCSSASIGRRPSIWEVGNPFELTITPHNVDTLLISARFYNQGDIVGLCKDVLVNCDEQNALYYRFIAEKHELVDILPFMMDYVRANFLSIVNTHSFLGLDLAQLKTLLADNCLNVNNELDVFYAVLAWIDHSKHDRMKVASEALGCVRFIHVSPEDIVRHVESKTAYFAGPGGREVLLGLYRYHALYSSTSDLTMANIEITHPRHYVPLGVEKPVFRGIASAHQRSSAQAICVATSSSRPPESSGYVSTVSRSHRCSQNAIQGGRDAGEAPYQISGYDPYVSGKPPSRVPSDTHSNYKQSVAQNETNTDEVKYQPFEESSRMSDKIQSRMPSLGHVSAVQTTRPDGTGAENTPRQPAESWQDSPISIMAPWRTGSVQSTSPGRPDPEQAQPSDWSCTESRMSSRDPSHVPTRSHVNSLQIGNVAQQNLLQPADRSRTTSEMTSMYPSTVPIRVNSLQMENVAEQNLLQPADRSRTTSEMTSSSPSTVPTRSHLNSLQMKNVAEQNILQPADRSRTTSEMTSMYPSTVSTRVNSLQMKNVAEQNLLQPADRSRTTSQMTSSSQSTVPTRSHLNSVQMGNVAEQKTEEGSCAASRISSAAPSRVTSWSRVSPKQSVAPVGNDARVNAAPSQLSEGFSMNLGTLNVASDHADCTENYTAESHLQMTKQDQRFQWDRNSHRLQPPNMHNTENPILQPEAERPASGQEQKQSGEMESQDSRDVKNYSTVNGPCTIVYPVPPEPQPLEGQSIVVSIFPTQNIHAVADIHCQMANQLVSSKHVALGVKTNAYSEQSSKVSQSQCQEEFQRKIPGEPTASQDSRRSSGVTVESTSRRQTVNDEQSQINENHKHLAGGRPGMSCDTPNETVTTRHSLSSLKDIQSGQESGASRVTAEIISRRQSTDDSHPQDLTKQRRRSSCATPNEPSTTQHSLQDLQAELKSRALHSSCATPNKPSNAQHSLQDLQAELESRALNSSCATPNKPSKVRDSLQDLEAELESRASQRTVDYTSGREAVRDPQPEAFANLERLSTKRSSVSCATPNETPPAQQSLQNLQAERESRASQMAMENASQRHSVDDKQPEAVMYQRRLSAEGWSTSCATPNETCTAQGSLQDLQTGLDSPASLIASQKSSRRETMDDPQPDDVSNQRLLSTERPSMSCSTPNETFTARQSLQSLKDLQSRSGSRTSRASVENTSRRQSTDAAQPQVHADQGRLSKRRSSTSGATPSELLTLQSEQASDDLRAKPESLPSSKRESSVDLQCNARSASAVQNEYHTGKRKSGLTASAFQVENHNFLEQDDQTNDSTCWYVSAENTQERLASAKPLEGDVIPAALVQERRRSFEAFQAQENLEDSARKTVKNSTTQQEKRKDDIVQQEMNKTKQCNFTKTARFSSSFMKCQVTCECGCPPDLRTLFVGLGNSDHQPTGDRAFKLSDEDLEELQKRIQQRRKDIAEKTAHDDPRLQSKCLSPMSDSCSGSGRILESTTCVRIHCCSPLQMWPKRQPACREVATTHGAHEDFEVNDQMEEEADGRDVNTSHSSQLEPSSPLQENADITGFHTKVQSPSGSYFADLRGYSQDRAHRLARLPRELQQEKESPRQQSKKEQEQQKRDRYSQQRKQISFVHQDQPKSSRWSSSKKGNSRKGQEEKVREHGHPDDGRQPQSHSRYKAKPVKQHNRKGKSGNNPEYHQYLYPTHSHSSSPAKHPQNLAGHGRYMTPGLQGQQQQAERESDAHLQPSLNQIPRGLTYQGQQTHNPPHSPDRDAEIYTRRGKLVYHHGANQRASSVGARPSPMQRSRSQSADRRALGGAAAGPLRHKSQPPYMRRGDGIGGTETDFPQYYNDNAQEPERWEDSPQHFTDDAYNESLDSEDKVPMSSGLMYGNHPYTNHGSHVPALQPTQTLVVAVGGLNPHKVHPEIPCRLLEVYDLAANCWSLLGKIPEARHHHGCVMLDGYLYVIGGSLVLEDDLQNMAYATNTCYRYDFGGNFWTAIAPMRCARMYHSVAVLEGIIYAMGGETGYLAEEDSRFLDSCEYYNPDTDEWGPIANMRYETIGAAVVGFRGLVWAIGGFLEHGEENIVLASVECYNPMTNSWIRKNHLPSPVCHASVAKVLDTLFVVGGSTVSLQEQPVESLDCVLRYLEPGDSWVQYATLRVPRHDAACCVVGSRLYVLGGVCSVTKNALSSVECLDAETGEWMEDVEPLSSPALGLACVSVHLGDFDQ